MKLSPRRGIARFPLPARTEGPTIATASNGSAEKVRQSGNKLRPATVMASINSKGRSMFDGDDTGRRDFLKCMAWAGTGALFTVSGGLSTSLGLDSAIAAPLKRMAATAPFTFAQLSGSHIGFNKPPNAD